jgi:hypothetical protein
MNLFRAKELQEKLLEKFRRMEFGEIVDFSLEEAHFAGAFQEDAIRFEDVDVLELGGRRHEQ